MITILGTNTAWILEQMKPKAVAQSKFYTNSKTKKSGKA
jgi:hypothetical protein